MYPRWRGWRSRSRSRTRNCKAGAGSGPGCGRRRSLGCGGRAAPDGRVVALLHGEGGDLVALAVGGGQRGDARLAPLRALVPPDDAAVDGEVGGVEAVDGDARSLVDRLGGDGDDESDVVKVEGPAAVEAGQHDVLACHGVGVCAGGHDGSGCPGVNAGFDTEVFGGRFHIVALVVEPVLEGEQVEGFAVGGFEGDSAGGRQGAVSWGREVVVIDWETDAR